MRVVNPIMLRARTPSLGEGTGYIALQRRSAFTISCSASMLDKIADQVPSGNMPQLLGEPAGWVRCEARD